MRHSRQTAVLDFPTAALRPHPGLGGIFPAYVLFAELSLKVWPDAFSPQKSEKKMPPSPGGRLGPPLPLNGASFPARSRPALLFCGRPCLCVRRLKVEVDSGPGSRSALMLEILQPMSIFGGVAGDFRQDR